MQATAEQNGFEVTWVGVSSGERYTPLSLEESLRLGDGSWGERGTVCGAPQVMQMAYGEDSESLG